MGMSETLDGAYMPDANDATYESIAHEAHDLYEVEKAKGLSIPRNYLGVELLRNNTNAKVIKAIVCRAYGIKTVVVGHHVCPIIGEAVEEIPAVDTLLFDHAVACAVFGPDKYLACLSEIAILNPQQRIDYYGKALGIDVPTSEVNPNA